MQNMVLNTEAEQAVLGCILVEGDLIKETSLQPEQFGVKKHSVIFSAMKEADKSGIPVDIVSVTTQLGNAIEEVGGTGYLMGLAGAIASTASFLHYQTMILESYRLREMQKECASFVKEPTDEGMNRIYKRSSELQDFGIERKRTKQDVLVEIYNDMQEEKGDITGIPTGLNDLNAMTGGWQDGDLIILAARPSMGKTAFSLGLGKANCENNSGVTDIFSLEMPDKQLTQRMLSNIGSINGAKWKNPKKFFSDKDYENATNAIGQYETWNINIHDQPSQTLAYIRSKIRQTKKENPGKKHLVIIDYLQLITPVGKFDRKDLEIGAITRELKEMALSFKLPIILLSQLSRAVEQRQDKRPMMSDLRESGSIEQDADIIAFLYRDEYYNKQSELKNIVEIDIAKQRNGPTGVVQAAFIKEYGRFINLDRQMEAKLA